jgi:hypothetical protein
MIAHVVLFRPRSGLSFSERLAFVDALAAARRDIPAIRRFRIGRRVTHGAGYEEGMAQDFPYAAVIEFADLAGLQRYLQHPSHERVGELFTATLDAGLVYDYEMSEDLEVVRRQAEAANG